jgi:Flp pilus assembly protein TadD
LQRALLERPQFITAYQNLGMTTLLKKYGAPLRAQLEAMVKKSPEYRPAQTVLVTVLEAQGHLAQAVEQVEKQVAANPKSADALLTLARLQLQQGHMDQGRATLDRVAALQPQNPEVLVRRAEIAADGGDFDEAARQLDALTTRYPKASQGWTLKAILYEQHGQLDKARSFYEQALQENRNDPIAANNLGLLLANSFHDPQGGLELAQRAHQLDSVKPEFTDSVGWLQYLCGNLPEALKTLGEAVRMRPDNATFHYHLGIVQSRASLRKEALSNLQTALSLDPHSAEAMEIRSVLARLEH